VRSTDQLDSDRGQRLPAALRAVAWVSVDPSTARPKPTRYSLCRQLRGYWPSENVRTSRARTRVVAAERDVVVIGAGISGLVCLWRLRQAGIDAILVEASDRVGGALRSERGAGFTREAGASTVQETPELAALVRELDLEEERVTAPPDLPRFVYRGGALHELPRGLLAMARSGLLSAVGKLRALAEICIPARRSTRDESVADFVVRRFGSEVLDAAVAPFVSGTFAGDPSALSVRAAFPSLVDLEARFGSVIRGSLRAPRRGTILSFRDGLDTLPRRLADRLGDRVQLGAEMTGVHGGEGSERRFEISIRRDGVEEKLLARGLVVTPPPWIAAPLVEAVAPRAAAELAAIPSAPLALATLAWRRSDVAHPLRGIGFLVAPGGGVRILGCLWPSSTFPGRAAEGQVTFTAFVGGALDCEGAVLSDDAIVEIVSRDLHSILGASGRPAAAHVDRYPRAIPQYTLGHHDRAERIADALAAVPGLLLAGNHLSGISVGECIRRGEEAAAHLAEFL